MPIAFTCPRCGKSYSVDAALAGRTGKCGSCGRPMKIPHFVDDGDDTIATEGYDLTEPLGVAAGPEEQSVFVPAGLDPEVPRQFRQRRPASSTRQGRPRRDDDDEPFLVRHRTGLIAIPVVLLAGLGLTALAVPGGTLIAACVLAGLGSLMVLVGYCVGASAAFHEDSLYGFFYLIFPFYSAYYILTRFEDLWPWFVAMTLGAGLIAVGGKIAESKLRDEPAAVAVRIETRDALVLACSP